MRKRTGWTLFVALSVVLIGVVVFSSGCNSKTTAQNGKVGSTKIKAASQTQKKMIVGKWIAATGAYLDIKTGGKLVEGVVTDETESVTYPYSMTETTLTIKYVEGKSATAKYTISGTKLTLKFPNSIMVFTKKK